MRVLMAAVIAIGACGVEPDNAARLPACAELGCRWAASGTPDDWTPCTEGQCWCDSSYTHQPPYVPVQCARTPCGDGPQLCATGQHAEHADYTGGSVCFCMPDGQ